MLGFCTRAFTFECLEFGHFISTPLVETCGNSLAHYLVIFTGNRELSNIVNFISISIKNINNFVVLILSYE